MATMTEDDMFALLDDLDEEEEPPTPPQAFKMWTGTERPRTEPYDRMKWEFKVDVKGKLYKVKLMFDGGQWDTTEFAGTRIPPNMLSKVKPSMLNLGYIVDKTVDSEPKLTVTFVRLGSDAECLYSISADELELIEKDPHFVARRDFEGKTYDILKPTFDGEAKKKKHFKAKEPTKSVVPEKGEPSGNAAARVVDDINDRLKRLKKEAGDAGIGVAWVAFDASAHEKFVKVGEFLGGLVN